MVKDAAFDLFTTRDDTGVANVVLCYLRKAASNSLCVEQESALYSTRVIYKCDIY